MTACGEGVEPGPGGDVFRWSGTSEPRTLDPLRMSDTVSRDLGEQIYEGLVGYRFEGQRIALVPLVAESWEVSEEGRVYTFHLRGRVTFHDDPAFPRGQGRPVTAADVKFSLERIADPELASTGWWALAGRILGIDAYHAGEAEEVVGIEMSDDRTVRIYLSEPFGPFLHLLALPYGYIVPSEATAYYGEDFGRHPVGTGPFHLAAWQPGERIILDRNPSYWGRDREGRQLPYLDRLEWRLVSEPQLAFLAFRRGELETIQPIPATVWEEVFTPDGQLRSPYDRYRQASSTALDIEYYAFNLERSPWRNNRALRRALNYGVDREALSRHITPYMLPAGRPLPPGLISDSMRQEGYRYDPERAQALLVEAGYPRGEGLPALVLQINPGDLNVRVAEAIQGMLQRIGVRVQIRQLSWPQHLETIERGHAIFFRHGWGADYPDAENFLGLFASWNFSPEGRNLTRYANPSFDALLRQALHLPDSDARDRLYGQAEALVIEDAPWLFLQRSRYVRLNQAYVEGFVPNPLDRRPLVRVWLNKGESVEGPSPRPSPQ